MAVEAPTTTEQVEHESATALEATPPVQVAESAAGRMDGGKDASEQPGTEANISDAGGGTDTASSPVSWLTDQFKELGKSYGFSDDELRDFKSAEEFNRAARILDRQIASFGQAARQPPETQKLAETQPAPATQTTISKLAKLDVERLKALGFDEESIAELTKLNAFPDELERLQAEREQEKAQHKQFENQFTQWQQYVAQSAQQQQAYDFHAAVDSLGDARFGKAFDADGRANQLTNEQHAMRDKLLKAAYDIEQGHLARGAQLPPVPIVVQRARNYAFADEIRKEERSRVQNEIAEQAKKRRPVAQQRGGNGQVATVDKINPFNLNEYVHAVANDPRLVAKFEQFEQENGQKV